MKKICILALLAFSLPIHAQFAVFDGTNAVNMGVEIGHSVTQIQKAARMLQRFQEVSSAVTRCNNVRKNMTQTISDLNDCRGYANSIALDATSAKALTDYYTAVNAQITRSTTLMTDVMTSGKFSLDDQARLEKLAQLSDYMRDISSQMKSVTYKLCSHSRVQDNYNKLKGK